MEQTSENSNLTDTQAPPLNSPSLDRLQDLINITDQTGVDGDEINNAKENTIVLETIADMQQDREERKKYATFTFKFLRGFTNKVLLIVFLCGLFNIFGKKTLDEKVLITLITTSLATIAGIFIYVMKYLFKQSDTKKEEQ